MLVTKWRSTLVRLSLLEAFKMAIRKVKIQNFKCFYGEFVIDLNSGLNILVGNNETGKSTILEAIHVALTGLYCGKSIRNELAQYLFNNRVVEEYIASINAGTPIAPPAIMIEIYFDESISPEFEGNGNSEKVSAEGLRFEIAYNEKFNDEYSKLIQKILIHI